MLLYKATGLYGFIITLKTWHAISHVEVYQGLGISAASREGQGVNYYPLRLKDLAVVMRPKHPYDQVSALAYADLLVGTPYGWWDLLNFLSIHVNQRGMVCSTFATLILRAAGIPIFNDEDANLVAPFQFLNSELLEKVWSL